MAIAPVLHPLTRANGSVTYTSPNGYTVLAAVNGPVEVPRREELLQEAFVEVHVRPSDGPGGVKERLLETTIAKILHDVVLVEMYPRQMIQLTLQLLRVPINDKSIGRTNLQAESHIPMLPWLLNASCLALLDGMIPMRYIFASTGLAMMPDNTIRESPTVEELKSAKSIQSFTFSSQGNMLGVESEGMLSLEEWGLIESRAKLACIGTSDLERDESQLAQVKRAFERAA